MSCIPILKFFDEQIEMKNFALKIRRLNNVLVDLAMKREQLDFRKEWVDDGLYWLNEFAETIDPYLEVEEK